MTGTIYHIAYRTPEGVHLARIRERTVGLAKRRLKSADSEAREMQRIGGLWIKQNLPGMGYKIDLT